MHSKSSSCCFLGRQVGTIILLAMRAPSTSSRLYYAACGYGMHVVHVCVSTAVSVACAVRWCAHSLLLPCCCCCCCCCQLIARCQSPPLLSPTWYVSLSFHSLLQEELFRVVEDRFRKETPISTTKYWYSHSSCNRVDFYFANTSRRNVQTNFAVKA